MITESYTGKYDYFNDLSTKKEGQVKSRRKHAEALAESNALTRAFNKVLPQLPQSFQPNELEKPFLIPYVEEDKNAVLRDLPVEDQKIIKNELARKRLGLMDTIYAPPAGSEASPTRTQVQEAEVVEEEKPKFTPEEEIHLQVETYRDVPQKERTEKILTLIKLKQFEDPKGGTFTASRIEKNTLDKQLQFMEKLLNLPDAEEGLPVD